MKDGYYGASAQILAADLVHWNATLVALAMTFDALSRELFWGHFGSNASGGDINQRIQETIDIVGEITIARPAE